MGATHHYSSPVRTATGRRRQYTKAFFEIANTFTTDNCIWKFFNPIYVCGVRYSNAIFKEYIEINGKRHELNVFILSYLPASLDRLTYEANECLQYNQPVRKLNVQVSSMFTVGFLRFKHYDYKPFNAHCIGFLMYTRNSRMVKL